MRLCVNWLPSTLAATRAVAQHAERAGLWGIGIGDSPRYAELYSACGAALEASSELTVTTCVTNPVTRHWSVHASAARGLGEDSGGRIRLGFGRGDSAVHSFGVSHATLRQLEDALRAVGDAVDAPLLLACSGPKTAAVGGRSAHGIIAGVGREPQAIADIARIAADAAPDSRAPEVWATIRIAVTESEEETRAMRRRLVPRAISASHFAFGSTFDTKDVPERFHAILRERYARYDYGSHGSSGATSNAALFEDHPEIEDYLLDRFAIVGSAEHCRDELAVLDGRIDGAFLSLVFEDAIEQIDRIGGIASALRS